MTLASVPRRLVVRAAAKACLRREAPVVVYTPPKSGSTSVERGLAGAKIPALKIHFLSAKLEATERRWAAKGIMPDRHLLASHHVRASLSRGVRPRFVTMVRDPIARLVSADFQSRRAKGLEGADTDGHLEHIRARVSATAGDPLSWFGEELAAIAGVDLEAEGFDPERGWQIYRGRAADVLLVKTTRLDASAETLGTFVGAPIRIGRENVRAASRTAEMYREVGARLSLPKEAVHRVADDRLVRLFFTEDERAAMIERWTG